MSIVNALTFIRRFETDKKLREICNGSKSKAEILKKLEQYDLVFTTGDFEEVINSLLVKCKTYEQAQYVEQIKIWFSLFQ